MAEQQQPRDQQEQPQPPEPTKKARRRITVLGVVRSVRMQKTIVVEVKRQFEHPRFHKYVRRSSHFYAHDEKNEAREGDVVEIVQTRPLSKLKRWRLVKIVAAAGGES
jgi:small subunit ribosomal protein S17